MAKFSKAEREEALATLRKLLEPGDTVYTKLNHVSRSGMSRSITPMLLTADGPRYLAWSTCVLFGQSRDKYDGVRMDGCGMDMGFALVYNLSYYLYPNGFGLEGIGPNGRKGRPATKEKAAAMVAKGWKFRGRNGDASGWDTDGGYALNQSWI